MQPIRQMQLIGLVLSGLLITSCTTNNDEPGLAEPAHTTTASEVERLEFVDRNGVQWIEFPDPQRASFSGATVTVARGTTLQIRATECRLPGMSLIGDAASLGKLYNKVVYTESNTNEVRDISLYIPPLLPEGRYEFVTTCAWQSDVPPEVDLSVRVNVVDKPDLVENPNEAHLPDLFCIDEPKDCDASMTPE